MKRKRYIKQIGEFKPKDCSKAKAAFGYYGAKQRISKKIIQSLPLHNCWVEAFCGSAAITLSKPPAPIEVINDIDGQIVNFFDQLRKNPGALYEAVSLTPYARQEFHRARKREDDIDDLERARRFLVESMMSVNGVLGGAQSGFSYSQAYSRGGREARVNRWYNLPERLAAVVERLRGVRVENLDARNLLKMFKDRPATLVYLDPPYFMSRSSGYVVDAKNEDFHLELLEICIKSKCMILISSYDNKLYNAMLKKEKGWDKVRIKAKTRDTTGKDYPRDEIFWRNKQYMKSLRSGRIPIRLSLEEKKMKKINPPR